jgi:hypothetical protein
MKMPSTAVILNRRRLANKSGKYPIDIRITINGTSKYRSITLPEKVSREQWVGADDYWVRNTHPFYFEINTKIREEKTTIQDIIKRYYMAGKKITFPMILDNLKQKGTGSCFNIFFEICNPSIPRKIFPVSSIAQKHFLRLADQQLASGYSAS